MRKNILHQLFLATMFVGISFPTYAYLDPGTGSLILQGVIAGIATVGFAAKMYWQRIKTVFSGESEPEEGEEKKEQAEHESADQEK
jgi:hypothetical protein